MITHKVRIRISKLFRNLISTFIGPMPGEMFHFFTFFRKCKNYIDIWIFFRRIPIFLGNKQKLNIDSGFGKGVMKPGDIKLFQLISFIDTEYQGIVFSELFSDPKAITTVLFDPVDFNPDSGWIPFVLDIS